MTRPTILDVENVVLLDLTPSDRPKPAWAAAAEKVVAQQMAGLTASVMRHAGDDDTTAWDDVRRYVKGLERTCANRDTANKELYDVCVSHAARADAAEARIAELEKRLADAERVIEPFAAEAACYDPDSGDGDDILWATPAYFKIRHLRAARAYMEVK